MKYQRKQNYSESRLPVLESPAWIALCPVDNSLSAIINIVGKIDTCLFVCCLKDDKAYLLSAADLCYFTPLHN